MKHFAFVATVLVALGLLAAACDDLPVKSTLLPTDSKLCIPVFENKTGEPNLDTMLTKKIIDNFAVDGRVRVLPKEQADLQLNGTLERYDRLVMTRDQNQVPQQYKLQLVVDLTLVDLKTNTALWTTHTVVSLTPGQTLTGEEFDSTNTTSLREFTTYYVLNVVGVPPEDEPTAKDRLLDQMAGRVVQRTVSGF